ncbi:MAG: glycoside hydrolase family 3 C-terminal domain-containing protein [Christensenellaceae bacterium]|jgi:beta-glucosidase|nr:glycoside hydrolase family 3 C-terminal domain-containing protein [Christensenellaceae bacterium]
MDKINDKVEELIGRLSVSEKALLCAGRNFWFTRGLKKHGISPYMVSDGPHGLRKQAMSGDHLGINDSIKATCFPPAVTMASTWDLDLIKEVGTTIGEEAYEEKLAVVLGPGANIKRSPLCGRNFEYYSEDPYLSGKMAANFIQGLQSKGPGTSLKHYAANNQETDRLRINAIIDERALREIYLASFETAVKEGKPTTLMCAYNQVNGEYASEDKKILTDILRDEWGFEGYVMTDWGAIFNRVKALKAGLDLEMPGGSAENVFAIVDAVESGELAIEDLDRVVRRLLKANLKFNSLDPKDFKYDREEHHMLAAKVASEGAVLLKNEDKVLPLQEGEQLTIIGTVFKTPVYQGGGSSQINPHKVVSSYDAFVSAGVDFKYAAGYSFPSDDINENLISEAVKLANSTDNKILLFVAVPHETEGLDRRHLSIPKNQNALIEALIGTHKDIVIIMFGGAPVEMPWINGVSALLQMYLPGQAGGIAVCNLVYGKVNPSGKLAETFPIKLSDTPCFKYFPQGPATVEYRESIFVGYRYYDTADVEVRFPFGFGLSYTKFDYSDIKVSSDKIKPDDLITVTVNIKNIGEVDGKEVVQLYVGRKNSKVFRAKKELKGFAKVDLKVGETKEVEFKLDKRSFAYYDIKENDWVVENGRYEIMIGASVEDIRVETSINIEAPEIESPYLAGAVGEYFCFKGVASNEAFEVLLNAKIPPSEYLTEPIRMESTINDARIRWFGRLIYRILSLGVKIIFRAKDETTVSMKSFIGEMLLSNPMRAFATTSGGLFTMNAMAGLIDMINGKFFKGLGKIIKARRKNRKQEKILKELEN